MSDLIVRAGLISRQHELNLIKGVTPDELSLLEIEDELRSIPTPTAKEKKYLSLFEEYLDTTYKTAILNSKNKEV